MRVLEQSIIESLTAEGVAARRNDAGRGVWAGTGEASGKIGSIGLHIASDVTTHGLMVNVETDLEPFGWIRPCGLDEPATSIERITGASGRMHSFSNHLASALAGNLGLRPRPVERSYLDEMVGGLGIAA